MRAIVMITGFLLIVIAGVLFGQAQSGAGFSPWSAVAVGGTGLLFFLVGLFMPSGGLLRQSGADDAGLDIPDGLDAPDADDLQ